MNNLRGVLLARLFLAISHLMGRDLPRALEESRAAAEIAEGTGDPLWVYCASGFHAWAESRLGNYEAAVESMARSKAICRSYGGRFFIDDWFAAADAEIALNAGRLDEALARAEETVAAAQAEGNIFAQGLAHRVWAAALVALGHARTEEAEAHLIASLHALESGGARLEAAWTHLAWIGLCDGRGDPSAAITHLEQATNQLAASGLTSEAERTRQQIAHSKRPKLRRPNGTHP